MSASEGLFSKHSHGRISGLPAAEVTCLNIIGNASVVRREAAEAIVLALSTAKPKRTAVYLRLYVVFPGVLPGTCRPHVMRNLMPAAHLYIMVWQLMMIIMHYFSSMVNSRAMRRAYH